MVDGFAKGVILGPIFLIGLALVFGGKALLGGLMAVIASVLLVAL